MGTCAWWSVPQECSTGYLGWGTGQGSYGLGDVCGKGYVITQNQIVTAGVSIDAVTSHMIVTVITVGRDRMHQEDDKQLVLCLAWPQAASWAKLSQNRLGQSHGLRFEKPKPSHEAVVFHWEYSIVLDTMCSELHRLPRGIFDPTCTLTQQKPLPTCWVQVFLQVRLVVPMGEIIPLPTTGYPQVHHKKGVFEM